MKRLFIISASLSFPDAGIMPKDPKTRVKVRQVEKFLAQIWIFQIVSLLYAPFDDFYK